MTGLTLPRRNGWMLPDDALSVLAGMVRDKKPGLILDIGSGRSTVVLADALRANGYGILVALEDNETFVAATRGMLADNDLSDWAEVRYAPLEPHGDGVPLAGKWYARDQWSDLENIDVLVVDGPLGASSRYARDPALPLLHDRLSPGALVVLDDTNRPDERETLLHWDRLGFHLDTFVAHSAGALTYGVLP